MKEGFRQSMAWLHTWTGLVVGWVLFFVFITGTAGYVRPELNRWMEPERPLVNSHVPTASEQFDLGYQWLSQHDTAPNAERWLIYLSTDHRESTDFRVGWQDPPQAGQERGKFNREQLDPATGQIVEASAKPRDTGGGNALYRMHYQLHYLPYDWAIRIVGICTMFMFVAIISGIITHKKILKDFFTFRPAKGQRSWLDAHNVLSVIALPFHIMITYSGLMFFLNAYMPLGVPMTYGFGKDHQDRYFNALYQRESSPADVTKHQSIATAQPQFIDVQKFIADKEQEWGDNSIRMISIHPANTKDPARIELYKTAYQDLGRGTGSASYDLNTGQILENRNTNRETAPFKFSDTMFALHEGRFADSLIRWVYVITGLTGTAMIATGLILWTVKRRVKATKNGKISVGHQLVEKLNIATVAGLPFAIAVYFWANRLLPVSMDDRAQWEIHSLFIAWLLSFAFALLRPLMKAWREILALGALAYLLLPVVNVLTTDRHLGVTIPYGDWVLVNVEIGFILMGLILVWACWKVHNKMQSPAKPVKKSVIAKLSTQDADHAD